MTFPISVALLSFQRRVFILNKQIWRGKVGQVGGLAMKQGAAATGLCRWVGAVVGDQDRSEETWVLSVFRNRPTM